MANERGLRSPIGARPFRDEGELGCLKAGAYDALLLVDGNLVANIAVLQAPERPLAALDNGWHRNRLCVVRGSWLPVARVGRVPDTRQSR